MSSGDERDGVTRFLGQPVASTMNAGQHAVKVPRLCSGTAPIPLSSTWRRNRYSLRGRTRALGGFIATHVPLPVRHIEGPRTPDGLFQDGQPRDPPLQLLTFHGVI